MLTVSQKPAVFIFNIVYVKLHTLVSFCNLIKYYFKLTKCEYKKCECFLIKITALEAILLKIIL